MLIRGIDEIDNRIVNLLLEDGRMSYSDIAEKIGLSRTAVKTRIAALERSGIIKGYKAIIDPQAAPEMMTFVKNRMRIDREDTGDVFVNAIHKISHRFHIRSQTDRYQMAVTRCLNDGYGFV